MKPPSSFLLVALLHPLVVSAQYRFTRLSFNTNTTNDAARFPLTNDPLYDITSTNARCNINSGPANLTADIETGTDVSFGIYEQGVYIYNQGPAAMYLGKVPEGETAATWDGSGQNWFKFAEWSGESYTNPWDPDSSYWEFSAWGKVWLDFVIPPEVPSGEYLLRVEQTGLHDKGKPQWFISCAQIRIVNGGQGKPPLVAIPGHIQPMGFADPNLQIDVGVAEPGFVYRVPGPDVWPRNGATLRPSHGTEIARDA